MKIAVIVLALALPLACQAELSYHHGRVLKITTEMRLEGRVTPPQGEDGKPQRQPGIRNYGEFVFISIQDGDDTYLAEVMSKAPGFNPQLLTSDPDIQFRIDGAAIYIKPSNGPEFAARLLPRLGRHGAMKQEPQSSPPK
jgi:hypothetical protein